MAQLAHSQAYNCAKCANYAMYFSHKLLRSGFNAA